MQWRERWSNTPIYTWKVYKRVNPTRLTFDWCDKRATNQTYAEFVMYTVVMQITPSKRFVPRGGGRGGTHVVLAFVL